MSSEAVKSGLFSLAAAALTAVGTILGSYYFIGPKLESELQYWYDRQRFLIIQEQNASREKLIQELADNLMQFHHHLILDRNAQIFHHTARALVENEFYRNRKDRKNLIQFMHKHQDSANNHQHNANRLWAKTKTNLMLCQIRFQDDDVVSSIQNFHKYIEEKTVHGRSIDDVNFGKKISSIKESLRNPHSSVNKQQIFDHITRDFREYILHRQFEKRISNIITKLHEYNKKQRSSMLKTN